LEKGAIEGVTFETATQSGVTNSAGEFQYIQGETIEFSIGELKFPSVFAEDTISPIELSAGSTNPDDTATNIARLLQSLDQDGYPYNGIVVPDSAANSAAPIEFNVSTTAFERDANVLNLVANSGSINTNLVSTADALIHLFQIETLIKFSDQVVGRQLVFKDSDGNRDESSQAMVNADGTSTGFTPSGNIDLEWNWDSQFYCRSGTSASGQTTVAFNCQVISVKNDMVTFVLDEGAGAVSTVWFIE
jgi:hypothetical protein